MSVLRRRLLMGGRGGDEFHLTANPKVGDLDVRLQTIACGVDTIIAWGDGAVTNVPANTDTDVTHTYSAPGSYRITIPRASQLTKINLQDGILSGLNTRELRGCRNMHTFQLQNAIQGVINSADMRHWELSWHLFLSGCPNIEGILNSADMADWRLQNQFYVKNCPNIAGTLHSADMVDWGLEGQFVLQLCPNIVYACSDPAHIVWNGINHFLAVDTSCTLATVDNVIEGFWDLRNSITYATPRLDLGGDSNATPGGTYQSACPPTTALEKVYNLAHAQCAGDTHHTWTVIWNGGSAP